MSFLVVARLRDSDGDYDVKATFTIDELQSSEWALQCLEFYREDEPEGVFKLFHLACMEDILMEDEEAPFRDVEMEVADKFKAGKLYG